MKPVLVTGATGFLGWHIARKLMERGYGIRLLVRPTSRLREMEGADARPGDLRDRDSLERAAAGCGVVYHVAADYRLWAERPEELYASNVDGTRHLLEAALKAGVERMVYTSTVGCIGIPKEGVGDERTPVSLDSMTGHYKRSKFLAEQEVLGRAARGFPVVVVNPTAPVGDHDWKPTPTGRMIVDYLRGRMPAYVDTGLNLVDAADTALGHLLACERGRTGERYILGGENLTLREIFSKLAAITGIPAPRVRLPYALAHAAGLASTAWAGWTGRAPRVPIEGVRMARKKMFVNTAKAASELDFRAGPAGAALGRAVDWFRANGYC